MHLLTPLLSLGLFGALLDMPVQAKTFPFCKVSYAKTPAHCDVFAFAPKVKGSTNAACTALPAGVTNFPDLSSFPAPPPLTKNQQHVVETLTNVFENGVEAFTYDACEDIKDGRGFTCGRIGFTSGTGDALVLLQIYQNLTIGTTPSPPILVHIKELERLGALGRCDPARGSTAGLPNFVAQWKAAAKSDPKFRQAQDLLNDQMYLTPGRRFAASQSVISPLGQAFFYDTIIQHGWQRSEPDINIMHIIQITGPRLANESEATYLARFLKTRRLLLCCYPNDDVWPEAADRVSDLQGLLAKNDLSLTKPLVLKSYGETIKGTSS